MTDVLNACLRIIAAVLLAGGAVLAVAAIQSDWSSFRSAATPIEHSGTAATAFSLFLIGCAMGALALSSHPRRFSAEVRLISALLVVLQLGAVALRYGLRGA